jgi:hypothetical protein
MPPEAAWRYGPGNDVWALGCITHRLAIRRLPHRTLHEPSLH